MQAGVRVQWCRQASRGRGPSTGQGRGTRGEAGEAAALGRPVRDDRGLHKDRRSQSGACTRLTHLEGLLN